MLGLDSLAHTHHRWGAQWSESSEGGCFGLLWRYMMYVSQVMRRIRMFVATFFSCAECRRHFLQGYDSCFFSRCDIEGAQRMHQQVEQNQTAKQPLEEYRTLQLWLWRFHNAVNVRTKLERAGRPQPGRKIRV